MAVDSTLSWLYRSQYVALVAPTSCFGVAVILGRHCLSLNLNLGRRPTPQQWPLRSHCHWHVVDRVGARRVALDQRRKYLRARSPRTGRETDESAHGWARCRSISGAVTRCVGAMYVYILIYTAGTDQIERNES